jgi:CRISPR-associated protein (TIGR03984 family)
MTIDYERIKAAFPQKAWAYAEEVESVKIGKWNGNELAFAEGLDSEYLTELRVFDKRRELKFTGGKSRDTADYDEGDFIQELAESRYYMYGETAELRGDYTALAEERGAILLFPARLDFSQAGAMPKDQIGLMLGIRNYVRYNPVPVLPKEPADISYDFGLAASGAGAIETVDYAYTGFFYANGKEVEL